MKGVRAQLLYEHQQTRGAKKCEISDCLTARAKSLFFFLSNVLDHSINLPSQFPGWQIAPFFPLFLPEPQLFEKN